jgi:hypothetical protein
MTSTTLDLLKAAYHEGILSISEFITMRTYANEIGVLFSDLSVDSLEDSK